jgi:hypothetical protein
MKHLPTLARELLGFLSLTALAGHLDIFGAQ